MKEEKDFRSERIKKFWRRTRGRKRLAFLFILQGEDIAKSTIYNYARKDFKNITGIILRGIESCIQDFEMHTKGE